MCRPSPTQWRRTRQRAMGPINMDTTLYAAYYTTHEEERVDADAFCGVYIGAALGALMWVPILWLIL